MFKDEDYCKCNEVHGGFAVEEEWGYWMHCLKCEKPLEDEFHYYNEPELY
ncbi:hypothetical protein [Bacillus altitudinis]